MADKLVQASQQLEQLRLAFAKKLPGRVLEIEEVTAQLNSASSSKTLGLAVTLAGLAHRLAGTAGTFGYLNFGEQASQLEHLCEAAHELQQDQLARHLQTIRATVKRMRESAEQLAAGAVTPAQEHSDNPLRSVPQPKRWQVMLVEDDLDIGEQLVAVMPNFSFEVKWYQHPSELAAALQQDQPDILLMDIMYPDGRDLGVSTVSELQQMGRLTCPVVYISARDDLDARLQAARTGCDGYLPKPLDIPDLVETLKHFTVQHDQSPYRVLAFEDDEDLIEWYRLVLGEAGFVINGVSDPAQLIPLIRDFKPDVILMDIEIPGYNGLDLAKVIRQYVEYLQIPIVFVTSAVNSLNRMDAWRSGGDDFLAKPVQPELLIPSLQARAEKSRALVSLAEHQKVKASRERFHVLARVSPVAMVYTDPTGLCLFVNPKFSVVTGAEPDEAFGKHWTHWVKTSERANVMKIWKEAVEQQQAFESALRFGGEGYADLNWMIVRASPQIDDNGETIGYATTFTDISELKRAEASLAEAKRLLEKTFASMRDSVIVFSDQEGEILHVNEAAESLFGYSLEELEGIPLAKLFINKDEYLRYFSGLRENIKKSGIFRTDVRMIGKDRPHLLAEHTVTSLDYDDQQGSFVLVVRDVTEPRALSRKLAYEASHDSLTGQYNRLILERRLRDALDVIAVENTECVLCYLDLDWFKLVNDACGHQAGDRALREISSLLASKVRKGDTLARIGGDEFAVLMERCDLEHAYRVANSMLEAVNDYHLDWEGKQFNVGVSIGMVCITRDNETVSDVLKAADSACYVAKEGGRSRIHVYQRDDEEHLRRNNDAHWGMLIEKSLATSSFVLFAQPIVAVNRAIHPGNHFEILLRMCDENGGLISPADFLPAAERFYLTPRIDRWVLHETLNWLAANEEIARNLHLCSINLSAQSLADDRLLDYVEQCFYSSSVPPERICFEITETAALSDIPKARRFIRKLKEAGCLFAIDDFGTGVSNFAYLKDLPVDFLKIDGSFIKDMMEDPLDMAVVKAINEIGHALGKETIAEYVWNEQLEKKLSDIGVDYVQGFHLGKPQPVETLK